MSIHFPIRTVTGPKTFNKTAVLGTAAPGGTTLGEAKAIMHGMVGNDGKVGFALGAGATVSVYVFSTQASKWLLLDGTVTAVADTVYSKEAIVGCPFFLVASTGTPTAWYYDERHTR